MHLFWKYQNNFLGKTPFFHIWPHLTHESLFTKSDMNLRKMKLDMHNLYPSLFVYLMISPLSMVLVHEIIWEFLKLHVIIMQGSINTIVDHHFNYCKKNSAWIIILSDKNKWKQFTFLFSGHINQSLIFSNTMHMSTCKFFKYIMIEE